MDYRSFADLEIRLMKEEKQGYPIEITLNKQEEWPRHYISPDILEWQASSNVEESGQQLFELLINPEIQPVWAKVAGRYPQRRIRLRIDETAPELHTIPWELLREQNEGQPPQTIAAMDSTPFSRYIAGQGPIGLPILKRPIKILVAISNPNNLDRYKNLVPIDVDKEWQLLQEVTQDIPDIEIDQLPQPCTLSDLEERLRQGYHILHFVGHGLFNRRSQTAALVMADRNNKANLVRTDVLAELLARQLANIDIEADDKLRLIVLASCQTATRSPFDAFCGVAPALVQAGVPAVLAMQDNVPIITARTFSQHFYKQLLQHGQVDLAVNEARSALITAKQPGFEIPVLFLQLPSGQLFGNRGQILGDRASVFWSTLLDNIAEGDCVPFLGPRLTNHLLPDKQQLAFLLSDKHHYPFGDMDNLPRVAQFVGINDKTRLRNDLIYLLIQGYKKRFGLTEDKKDRRKRKRLSEVIEASQWSTLCQATFATEIHHQLAEFELPIYITTNFDNFMTLALRTKQTKVRQIDLNWRDLYREDESTPFEEINPPPSDDNPVVLHLFGTDQNSETLVLTEDDYLDYLTALARNFEYLIPTNMQSILASKTLLFLGYKLDDMELRVIMRGILTLLDLKRWDRLHVAVQIDSTMVDQAKTEEVTRFFQKYFQQSKIDVYWGSTQQFIDELYTHWQEY